MKKAYGTLVVHSIPSGAAVSFTRPGNDKVVVGTARRYGRQWQLRVPGHQWKITPDMPIARFQRVPGGSALTETPVKSFASWQACAREIENILGGQR